MATFEFDPNVPIMEQIQKLTKPPVNEEAVRRQRRLDRENNQTYKKTTGKNHDFCDSCKEGGDLLCCDKCPAAFHLQCHDPPLDEEDVPKGQWLCHRCRCGIVEGGEKPILTGRRSGKRGTHQSNQPESGRLAGGSSSAGGGGNAMPWPGPPVGGGGDGVNNLLGLPALRMERGREGLSASGVASSGRGMSCSESALAPGETPFDMLLRVAGAFNPEEFKVPNDMMVYPKYPQVPKKKAREQNPRKKLAHELDNGIVPLPAKLCFSCHKSCRHAALVQCDYCPLLFHLDCLSPPLTAFPVRRWMCPNHPEKILEEKFGAGGGLTKKTRLMDKYSGPVNHQAIKVKFLKKVHRKREPWEPRERPPSPREAVGIPSAIRGQYTYPPPPLPQPEAYGPFPYPPSGVQSMAPSLQEKDLFLSSLAAMQSRSAQQPSTLSPANLARKDTSTDKDTASSGAGKQHQPGAQPSPQPPVSPNAPVAALSAPSASSVPSATQHLPLGLDTLNGPSSAGGGARVNGPMSLLTGSPAVTHLVVNGELEEAGRTGVRTPISAATSILNSMVGGPRPSVFGGAAGAKTAAVATATPGGGKSYSLSSSQSSLVPAGKTAISPYTTQAIQALTNLSGEMATDLDVSKLDGELVKVLAAQRLQQLLPAEVSQPPLTPHRGGVLSELLSQPTGNQVRARATLCPVGHIGQPVPMAFRTFSIGTGANMDASLPNFGFCNFVSSYHACIFFDEVTKEYELMNYSEHGTVVDNVLYSSDISKDTLPLAMRKANPPPCVMAVRKVVAEGKGKGSSNPRARKAEDVPEDIPIKRRKVTMNKNAGKSETSGECQCKVSSSCLLGPEGAGWEGTALLHHGSHIKMGCLQFVFSVVDYASETKADSGSYLLSAGLMRPLGASLSVPSAGVTTGAVTAVTKGSTEGQTGSRASGSATYVAASNIPVGLDSLK